MTTQLECPGDMNPAWKQEDESTEPKEVIHGNVSSDSHVHGIRSQNNEESVELKTCQVCKPKDLSLDTNIKTGIVNFYVTILARSHFCYNNC